MLLIAEIVLRLSKVVDGGLVFLSFINFFLSEQV